MVRLLIFDFDGTLFDTAPGINTAINGMLRRRGLEEISLEKTTTYIGGGLVELARRLWPDLHEDPNRLDEIIKEFRKDYSDVFLTESYLYEGVVEFLKAWPHQLAIASNKTEFFVRELVRQSTLNQFSWVKILGGDSLPKKKPHPLPLIECLKSAGLEPHEALMIGDGTPDVEAAKAAGIPCVAVGYGYTPLAKLMDLGANYSIADFAQLARVLGDEF